ncbi:hypothetical protein BOSE21B_10888 [Bosea sp. 21B]|nr:hypothetical protein BOSE21B_10888 [Bosea sp. 21B]
MRQTDGVMAGGNVFGHHAVASPFTGTGHQA